MYRTVLNENKNIWYMNKHQQIIQLDKIQEKYKERGKEHKGL